MQFSKRFDWINILRISALTNKGINLIEKTLDDLYQQLQIRVSTSDLNICLIKTNFGADTLNSTRGGRGHHCTRGRVAPNNCADFFPKYLDFSEFL